MRYAAGERRRHICPRSGPDHERRSAPTARPRGAAAGYREPTEAPRRCGSDIYKMVPYAATLVVLAFTSKNSQAPRASGVPYDKGSR